jgi:alpha-N-arabinofuranosidase
MLPVEWKNGWPHILEGNAAVGRQYPVPMAAVTKKVNNPFNGNLVYIDRFESATLNPRWMMMRNMHTAWYKTGKGLELQVQPQTVGGRSNPSYLAFRFQHHYGIAETSLRFTASDSSEKAGLLLFQNETHFYYLCQSFKDGRQVVQLLKSTTDSLKMETVSEVSINDPKGALQLSIEANGDKYNFSYSLDGKTKQSIAAGIDARYLSTKIAGGFVGCTVGPYGTSMGKPSTSKAFFASFTYRGNEK